MEARSTAMREWMQVTGLEPAVVTVRFSVERGFHSEEQAAEFEARMQAWARRYDAVTFTIRTERATISGHGREWFGIVVDPEDRNVPMQDISSAVWACQSEAWDAYPPEWVTTTVAENILGVNQSRVRQLALAGQVVGRKVGRDWQINRQSAEAWQASHAGQEKRGRNTMAGRTNYQHLVNYNLGSLARETGDNSVEVAMRFDAIARQLHNHDGWCDWREIWQAIYDEAHQYVTRSATHSGRSPIAIPEWMPIAIENWFASKQPH